VAYQDLKWWHVRWRPVVRAISRFAIISGKIAAPLCLLAALGYGVIYLESPWLESQRMSKFDPRLSIVPTELSAKIEAPLSNASIDCYGFTLQLPNNVTRTIPGKQYTSVLFRNEGDLTIQSMTQDGDMLELTMRDKTAQKLLGREVLRSKFSLMQAAMWATPEQAKWWRFRTLANERVAGLLTTKFFAITKLLSLHFTEIRPIYTIAVGELHGFQVGNPDVAPYEAHVDLFDGTDRHFAFDVTGPEGHGHVLNQTEINAIVGSIKPVPDRP
jgi:hypothetical protein